jgi:SAM-dependent methyltransferase
MSDRESARDRIPVSDAGRQRQLAFFRNPEMPEYLQRLVEAYIERKTGKAWDDPAVLDRIRNAIIAQKSQYWREGRVGYRKAYQILGYLAYHAPVYLVQFEHIFWQLVEEGLVGPSIRILDVGTGPGVVPLAVIDLLGRTEGGSARIFAIERSEENLEAYNFLVPGAAGEAGRVEVEKPLRADLGSLPMEAVPDRIDLAVFSNVLNELRDISIDRRADLVAGLSERLAPDGTIVIIEPADLANSTALRRTVQAIADAGLTIYAPCSFIRGTTCNPSRCWTFEQKGNIRPTRLMERLAGERQAYRFLNVDIKYSSAILRRDGKARCAYRVPARAKFVRFSQLHRHLDRKVNAAAALMSGNLGDSGTGVHKLCDGTPAEPVYAVIPRTLRGPNRDLFSGVPYGGIVHLFGVLVRYNKEHAAYNLVILPDTRIERVQCG